MEFHNESLKIRTELNDGVGMAKVYYRISFIYSSTEKNTKLRNDKVLYNLNKYKQILEEFEKEIGYQHPFFKDVLKRIKELEK